MNKRAVENGLMSIIVYLILVVLFLSIMYYYVSSQKNGAALWEDFYAKEISKIINSAGETDQLSIDVQIAGEIARKNNAFSEREMFNFDNDKKEVCVKLSPGRKSCYHYFNEVEVIGWRVEPGVPVDTLRINLGQRVENDI